MAYLARETLPRGIDDILARTVGPAVRGEYAAITAWLDLAVMIGQCGQPAAVCYYVASDPLRARRYVATSRVILLSVGVLMCTTAFLLTPILARGDSGLAGSYRIALAGLAVLVAGCSYVSALQARALHQWNLIRVSQPVLSLLTFGVLWSLRLLTLRSALIALTVTLLVQVVFPRLAAGGTAAIATRRLQMLAVLGSAGIAAGLLVPLGAAVYRMIPLIFGQAYLGAVPLLWLLIPGAVFAASGGVATDLLRGRKNLAAVALAQGFAAVVLVVLTIVLLPFIGVRGCAVSYSVSYGLALIMMLRSL